MLLPLQYERGLSGGFSSKKNKMVTAALSLCRVTGIDSTPTCSFLQAACIVQSFWVPPTALLFVKPIGSTVVTLAFRSSFY